MWWGPGDPHEAILSPDRCWSFSPYSLLPSPTFISGTPSSSCCPPVPLGITKEDYVGNLSPAAPNLEQGDFESLAPALGPAGTAGTAWGPSSLRTSLDLCSLVERNPRQKSRKDRRQRQRKDRKSERRLQQPGSQ